MNHGIVTEERSLLVPRCIQDLRDGRCYVYFIGGDDTPIKIGKSTAPYERLATLQNAHWLPLRLIAKVEGGLVEEAALHARFASTRLMGEWFQRSDDLEELIVRLREEHGEPMPFYTPAIDTRPRSRMRCSPTPLPLT